MNDRLEIIEAAIVVRDGRIASIGREPDGGNFRVVDAGGGYLLRAPSRVAIHSACSWTAELSSSSTVARSRRTPVRGG